MSSQILTQKELKEILTYHESSGEFTWNYHRGSRARKGSCAGTKTKIGYIDIAIRLKKYGAHRLAFLYITGEFPIEEVDHINGDKSDNRLVNLRQVSRLENSRNSSIHGKNKTGITGVFRSIRDGGWRGQIRVNYKQLNLGRFDDFFEACCARKSAERKYGFHENHGRPIRLN